MRRFPKVVANYICIICGVKGDHWIMQCPTHDSDERQKDRTISTIPLLICGYTRKIKIPIPSDVTNLIEFFHSKVIINNSYYTIKHCIRPLTAFKWWHGLDDSVIAITGLKSKYKCNTGKWNTLDHNGVIFPPEYKPHGVPIKYDDKEIFLTPDQEEIATMFAKFIHLKCSQKETFRNNFMKDFKKILCDKNQKITYPHIIDLDLCDFNAIYDHVKKKRQMYTMRRIYKQDAEIDKRKEIYGYAIVDGVRDAVECYMVTPPGLFRVSDGDPNMGRVRRRILPKDVILNIGENTPIPPCPISGQQWGGIIHDNRGHYIAKWVGNIDREYRFLYIGGEQRFNGESNRNMYEKARLLNTKIDSIRRDYKSKLISNNLYTKQLATVIWIIDKLCIQVGNEWDTNAVCSLRKGHVILLPMKNNANDDNEYRISLNFAKFIHTLEVPYQIWRNLNEFLQGKNDNMDVFEMIKECHVTVYLRDQMIGLNITDCLFASSMIELFRIFNKSVILENELINGRITTNSSLEEKLYFYQQCELRNGNINDMDPRITVAWCKRLQVPIHKIFNKSKSLSHRHEWAMQCSPNYRF